MFDKLPLKSLKFLIKEYKLATKIVLSKTVDGKRKPKTPKEIADELHKHLEIRKSDGEIIMKEHKFGKMPKEEVKTLKKVKPVKEVKAVEKSSIKTINANDSFFIYDNKGKDDTIDLTKYYSLPDVTVLNNSQDLLDIVGDSVLMDFEHMTEKNGEKKWNDFISNLRMKEYGKYEEEIVKRFPDTDSRDIQIFISSGGQLIGFIRSVIYDEDLHISFVYVNDNGFQGRGYVGEMMSILFEYLIKIKIIKDIKTVELDYFADSTSGWIAYDKGISRYGFKNKELNYTAEDLKDVSFIKKIHKKFDTKEMIWTAEKSGKGMRKSVEDIEMRI